MENRAILLLDDQSSSIETLRDEYDLKRRKIEILRRGGASQRHRRDFYLRAIGSLDKRKDRKYS